MLKIFTDTDTDLTLEEAEKYGYKMISMPYIVGDKEVKPYVDFKEFDYKKFYGMLREGTLPTTCAISTEEYIKYFEPEFAEGNDILYVHFSRSMTVTFDNMDIAVNKLKEKYPDRKFYSIDTKGITINSLIIVKAIGDMYLEGKTAEEIVKWAEEEVSHYATYFFADDLKFFKRSGRVSNLAAIMGGMIGLKPIICMGEDGKMTNVSKAIGRNNALNKLVSCVTELGLDVEKHRVIVGHADALELAKELANKLQEVYDNKLNIEFAVVNPTAGSHCGPDTVGVAFHATKR